MANGFPILTSNLPLFSPVSVHQRAQWWGGGGGVVGLGALSWEGRGCEVEGGCRGLAA